MRGWAERLRLIWLIIGKDLSRARVPVVISSIVAGVLAFLIAPVPLSIVRFGPTFFVWSDPTLRAFYAVSSFLTALTLALTFYSVHSGEVHKGTIRSIILYPVDANDIAIAKLGSTFLLSFLVTTILFFGAMSSFFVLGVFPFGDFLAVHLVALGEGFVCLATGTFLAQVLAHFTKRMTISPAALASLFLLASILLTELSANAIASRVVDMAARSGGRVPTSGDFEAAAAFARAVSVLSPHHWGARVLSIAFGIFRAGGELPMAIPAAFTVLSVTAGYVWGRKLYLDVFIR